MSATAPASGGLTPGHARFVVMEDDELLRDLLVRVITAKFAPRSLRAFADGQSGLAHCLAEPPDLLLTDLRMPGCDGREVIRRLRAAKTPTRVVVLTQALTASLPGELIALGVAGFIDKSSPLEQIERAIERVLAGGLFFSASISPTASPHVGMAGAADGPAPSALNERELEIARLVSAGLFSKEIGERLNLSPRTVEKERVVIMEKLGVRDLPGLIRWCVRHGLA